MEALFGLVVVLSVAYFAYKKIFKKDNTTAPLTLSASDVEGVVVTQAATDGVEGVFVNFTGLEIQPAEGERLSFEFGAKVINLMEMENKLLDEQEVPVGQYNWIRLKAVTADSKVVFNGVEQPLDIPSGDQSGLKLNRGFRVGEEGADFTIDFNLNKSLINPGGKQGWKLKPVLGLIDNLGPVDPPEEGSPEA